MKMMRPEMIGIVSPYKRQVCVTLWPISKWVVLDRGRGTWDVGRGTWDVGRGTFNNFFYNKTNKFYFFIYSADETIIQIRVVAGHLEINGLACISCFVTEIK
jgi:hypothetical protein